MLSLSFKLRETGNIGGEIFRINRRINENEISENRQFEGQISNRENNIYTEKWANWDYMENREISKCVENINDTWKEWKTWKYVY